MLLLLSLLISGCASFSTEQTDKSVDANGMERTITTKAKASTFVASKSALANWKASQTDKTQGATVGSLNQDTESKELIATVIEALVRALAVKP